MDAVQFRRYRHRITEQERKGIMASESPTPLGQMVPVHFLRRMRVREPGGSSNNAGGQRKSEEHRQANRKLPQPYVVFNSIKFYQEVMGSA